MTEREKRFIDERFADPAQRQAAYDRLAAHEPLAYILGEWYFYDEVYHLNRDCLIPRADTEHLVEAGIRRLPKNARFLDLCTGSGCVAISILRHRPDLTALALDIAPGALEMASENAALNGVAERIELLCGDLLSETLRIPGTFGGLVSNPPYIRPEVIEGLSEEVRREPRAALDGGEDGLVFYRRIAKLAPGLLLPGAPVLVEIGYDQADAVCALFGAPRTSVLRDYGGNDRVVCAVREDLERAQSR